MKQVIVWNNQPQYATGIDHITVGLGNSPEFREFDLHGKLRRIVRWKSESTELVTDADRASYDSVRAEYLKRSPEDSIALPPISMLKVVKTKPVFTKILIDRANNTWLCQCADRVVLFNAKTNQRNGESWIVFDSTGTWLGSVRLPKGLNAQRVGSDELGGVHLDSDDVPSLRLHRIQKPK